MIEGGASRIVSSRPEKRIMANEFEALHDRVEACRRHLTAAEMSAAVRGELLQLLADLDERLADQAIAPR